MLSADVYSTNLPPTQPTPFFNILLLFVFFCFDLASVITNLTDITNATENSPVSLQCSNPDEAEVYSWNYTPSNPLESVKSVQGSSIYNVTSSKLTGYYSCFLGADLVSKFQAISKFVDLIKCTCLFCGVRLHNYTMVISSRSRCAVSSSVQV